MLVKYLVINVIPRRVLEPWIQVWGRHDNLVDAETHRESYLKELDFLDPQNLQVIQYNSNDL